MNSDTFVSKPNWISNKGVILYTYKLLNDLQKNKSKLLDPVFEYIGFIDCYNSIIKS